MLAADHWAPRPCLRASIPDIELAASYLSDAVDAHIAGNRTRAAELIELADIEAVREWVTSLMRPAPRQSHANDHHRVRRIEGAPSLLPKTDRPTQRMPGSTMRAEVIARDGYRCVFCDIPVIRAEVRKELCRLYPDAARWGASWEDCHAALLCMWLQFDHVLPHGRGGLNVIENLVITCSGCNYGRMDRTLAEMGLTDPRLRPRLHTNWDGLERVMRG